jgi:hypothetical protein
MRWLTTGRRKHRVIPEGTAYIGCPVKRGGCDLPRSKWANRFKTPRDTRAEVIARYLARARSLAALVTSIIYRRSPHHEREKES